MVKQPELLAPVGNMEKLIMALAYGADAVYLGGENYSLRAQGGNFDGEAMAEAVRYTHRQGKKAYVTVNIYPHDEDLRGMPDYFRHLSDIGADAALVADLGVFSLAREAAPELPLHVSTQANTLNSAAVKAWAALGASRVVLGRELSRAEIKEIRRSTDVELEMFIHGAMCISYSGRCLLSNFLTGRDANRGSCTQPCRWSYNLVEEKRPGEYFPIEEDGRGTYIFNSKDMSFMPFFRDVLELGIDSLKIEGRMKSVHYVSTVTRAYRRAIDAYFAASDKADWRPEAELLAELDKVSHREYGPGFFFGRAADGQYYPSSTYRQAADFVAVVRDFDEDTGRALLEQRNCLAVGETVEIMPPTGEIFRQPLTELFDAEHRPIERAPHPQQRVYTKLARPVPPLSIIRRPVENEDLENR